MRFQSIVLKGGRAGALAVGPRMRRESASSRGKQVLARAEDNAVAYHKERRGAGVIPFG